MSGTKPDELNKLKSKSSDLIVFLHQTIIIVYKNTFTFGWCYSLIREIFFVRVPLRP